MTDDLIGKHIGDYEILGEIGRGGMATVYRARQTSMLNRIVALKLLPRHLMSDTTYLQRFEREVEIVSRLEHRSIVPVYAYGEHEGQPYIVMRYMAGGSIDQRLNAGPMSPAMIISIFEQICPALDHAHAKDVLHRDLKPSNVLLDESGGAFLTDFGIARVLGENNAGTITTQGVVGTPSYMSPEQAQGKPLDNRSDLYSMGVMLFEMATGRRPFEADTPYGIAVAQVTEPPPTPRSIHPDVPPPLESVILTSLSKNRDQRYESAAALMDALKKAVQAAEMGIHDTQPGMARPPLPADEPPVSLEATIPLTATPPPVIPAPPPQTPSEVVNAYVPPMYAQTGQMTSGNYGQVPSGTFTGVPSGGLRRRVRQSNLWMSAALGGLIGCGLFTVIAIVAVLLISSAADGLPAAPTAPADDGVPALPTNTAPALASTNTPQPDATPTPVGATPDLIPVGVVVNGEAVAGTLVYSAERAGNFDIYLLDLATGAETRLTENPSADVSPYPSPDGESVVFASDRDGDFELYLLTLDSGSLRALTDNAVDDVMPSFSPQGSWIVFASDTSGDGYYDLFRVGLNGAAPERLFSSTSRNADPYWSATDNSIYFSAGEPGDARTWELRRLDLDVGAAETLTENSVRDRAPALGADGALLFETEGEGYGAIAVFNAATRDQVVLYDGAGFDWGPSLSPDGRFIAFTSDVSGRDELYVMTSAGEDVTLVTTTGGMGGVWMP
ncbi:MAG: protein kinase [Pleurocapsa minor GSE-CHR-MK-17-07R]|jgi:serine/threonine protein kinase/Tol biopolymer transport system component|nr:protein kinase [Pleurocapsa minor GSE-CHR-MK 17-07R]